MHAFGAQASTIKDLYAWLSMPLQASASIPHGVLLVPPGLDSFLRGGGAMIAVPRCGEKLYPVADYTTTASTSVLQPIELILGQTRLTADDRGMLLQNPSWAILGDSISSIANEIVLKCPDRPVVDVLSTWEAAIGMMFSMLGPMRSASLVWKIYGTTEAIFETQQGEAYAFLILAGWFPGLCRYTAPSPSDEKTSEIGRCSLQIYRGPELYNILAAHLASIGWLPDAPIQNPGAPGPESYYCPPTRLGTIVRRTSRIRWTSTISGHHLSSAAAAIPASWTDRRMSPAMIRALSARVRAMSPASWKKDF
jgi:hypothetical protein